MCNMKLYLVTFFLVLGMGNSIPKNEVHKPLLVISLDGFDKSYMRKYEWEHFSRFFSKGSTPADFRNQFTTKTFPNHFSIATGVYEEVHGVVGNNVYDPELKRIIRYNEEGFFTQNPEIMPIWTLNEANGGHSGCIMWPGCDVEYDGRNVTYYLPFNKEMTFKESISTAVQWLTDVNSPANLIFLYNREPDDVGHAYGPNSINLINELQKIDEGMDYLFSLLLMNDIDDDVDIIVLSDHGMSAVPEENIIDLNDIVDSNLYLTSGSSPVLGIWPVEDKVLQVYKALDEGSKKYEYTVHTKEEIPADWHYSLNSRIAPIILVAHEGYAFQDFFTVINGFKQDGYPDLTNNHGDHGYPVNASNMEPIFVAMGPSFKHRFTAPVFSNLDVYPLICHLLALTPGPNNGTLKNISTLLSEPISSVLIKPLLIALGCLAGLMAVIGIVACALAKRDSRRVSADSLINGYIHRKNLRIGSIKLTDDDEEADTSEEEGLLENEVIETV